LLRDGGIKIGEFMTLNAGEKVSFSEIKNKLKMPVFVKPANLGSSVGINKARNKKELKSAVQDAFKYDSKIIIEENIIGREIECSVLGNKKPMASVPGEVIANEEFYSYDAKYKGAGSKTEIPAKLSKEVVKKVQNIAVQVFEVLECEGMGRVDVFVKKNGEVIVNEINTIPGFTAISMYPKMWEASGLPLPKLLDRLIALAIERHQRESKLKTTVS
jgi:D-alanine-D-alanine ligase